MSDIANQPDTRPSAKRASQRGLLRSIAELSGSTALSHGLLFLSAPLLTRLYSPSDFGLFAWSQSVMAIGALLVTLQLDQAIPVPRNSSEAVLLRRAALLISLACTLGGAGLCWLLLSSADISPGKLSLATVCLIPFCALGEAWGRTYRMACVRERAIRPLSFSRMTFSAGTIGGQLGLALCGGRSWGLIAGDGIGRWISILPLLPGRSRDASTASPTPDPGFAASLRAALGMAWGYRTFAWTMTPGTLLTYYVTVAPALLLPMLYGNEPAGQFSMANRTVLLPLLLISQAVTSVFQGEAATMVHQRDPRLAKFVLQTAGRMTCLGLLIAVPVAASAPWGLPWLLGAEWKVAGALAPLLALSGFSQFVGGPVQQVLVPLREEFSKFWLHAVGAVVVTAACVGGKLCSLTIWQTTLLYAVAISGLQCGNFLQAARLSRRHVASWGPSAEHTHRLAA